MADQRESGVDRSAARVVTGAHRAGMSLSMARSLSVWRGTTGGTCRAAGLGVLGVGVPVGVVLAAAALDGGVLSVGVLGVVVLSASERVWANSGENTCPRRIATTGRPPVV
ncbi:hypothetical protein AHOG_23370 [Actinoalloteichus hoggarensis]|uniref:Uncharacterized protein n=1 Tax=Actinoalloteichus hoggarensis TaxID=1470176 RepID=A0A221W8F7_9PSEU|nr:hypothetical protein AHOG_23370 [Actinoalloteichus hoggarensis]